MAYHTATTKSDERLISAIKSDDHNSFKELFDKYYYSLIRYAWCYLHSLEDSRDIVQELFVKLWINRNNLDPSKSIKSYMYKSVKNFVINKIKSASNKIISNGFSEDIYYKETSGNLDDLIDLKNVLEKMPIKLKEIYILSRIEKYKHAEIAEICGISIKTVEKRIFKMFEFLRKNLSHP